MPPGRWDGGDSFFLSAAGSHLYFLLHAPVQESVVVVNFITIREWINPPCIIYPNEHDFLTEKSTIDISRARLWTIQQLTTSEQSNLLKRHIRVSDTIVSKALKAVSKSKVIETRVLDFLRIHGLIQVD